MRSSPPLSEKNKQQPHCTFFIAQFILVPGIHLVPQRRRLLPHLMLKCALISIGPSPFLNSDKVGSLVFIINDALSPPGRSRCKKHAQLVAPAVINGTLGRLEPLQYEGDDCGVSWPPRFHRTSLLGSMVYTLCIEYNDVLSTGARTRHN